MTHHEEMRNCLELRPSFQSLKWVRVRTLYNLIPLSREHLQLDSDDPARDECQ